MAPPEEDDAASGTNGKGDLRSANKNRGRDQIIRSRSKIISSNLLGEQEQEQGKGKTDLGLGFHLPNPPEPAPEKKRERREVRKSEPKNETAPLDLRRAAAED
jgi:hypothetical protein